MLLGLRGGTIFSVQAMLGEVRRLVTGTPRTLPPPHSWSSPQQSFLYAEVLLHSSLFLSSHLPGVEIISVSGVMIFPQVVHKRKRSGTERERQKEGYTKVKSSEL